MDSMGEGWPAHSKTFQEESEENECCDDYNIMAHDSLGDDNGVGKHGKHLKIVVVELLRHDVELLMESSTR